MQAHRAHQRNRAADEVARGSSELAALLRAGHRPARWGWWPKAHRALPNRRRTWPGATTGKRDCNESVIVRLRGLVWPRGHVANRTTNGASMTIAGRSSHLLDRRRELRRSVGTELAAARMTGRLLGFLPLVGSAWGTRSQATRPSSRRSAACGARPRGGLAVAGVVWSTRPTGRATR